jgi:hypothetical protein
LFGATDDVLGEDDLQVMIREKRSNPRLFEHYMTHGVKYMVGATTWKNTVETGAEKPMDVATASDEAMTLLIYENYWHSWNDKHQRKEVI